MLKRDSIDSTNATSLAATPTATQCLRENIDQFIRPPRNELYDRGVRYIFDVRPV